MAGGGSNKKKHQKINQPIEDDNLLFDKLCGALPPAKQGYLWLLGSFWCQLALISVGFAVHHYKEPEFGCCNMWAAIVTLFFLSLQHPYLQDWMSRLGTKCIWHRANLFAPILIFHFLFILWLAAIKTEACVYRGHITQFVYTYNTKQGAAFIICTLMYGVGIWLLISMGYTHRNNLGEHYYAANEPVNAAIHIADKPIRQDGSFNYRNLMRMMAFTVGCETSEVAAEDTRNGWLATGTVYAFLHLLSFGFYARTYWSRALATRKWNRTHVFVPLHHLFAITFAYIFGLSTLLFSATNNIGNNTLWDDFVKELDVNESVYFVILRLILLVQFILQLVLANLHSKGWADGTGNIDDNLDYSHRIDLGEEHDRTKSRSMNRGDDDDDSDSYTSSNDDDDDDAESISTPRQDDDNVRIEENEHIRQLLRDMSIASDVPIEPPIQTELLDFTMKQRGVIFCGVPGAGGYDAIFAIVESNDDVIDNLEQQWKKQYNITRLPLRLEPHGLCIQEFTQQT